jgi:hypothetical protein
LLSNIVWGNEDNPYFEVDFGSNANIARAIVRQAVSDWEQLIVDFGFTHVGRPNYAPTANTFYLGVNLLSLPEGEVSAVYPDFTVMDREYNDLIGPSLPNDLGNQGKPYRGVINLDDNGGGHGWYFGLPSQDSTRFTHVDSAFSASGDLGGREDFYTAVLHAIGLAVGLDTDVFSAELFGDAQSIGLVARGPGPTQDPLYALGYYPSANDIARTAIAIRTGNGLNGLYDGPLPSDIEPGVYQVITNDLMDYTQPVNTQADQRRRYRHARG